MATSASCISIVCCLMSPVAIVIVIVVSVLISACFPLRFSICRCGCLCFVCDARLCRITSSRKTNESMAATRALLINQLQATARRQAGRLSQSLTHSSSQSVNRAVPQSAGNSSKAAQTNKLSHSRLRLRLHLPHLRHLLFLDIDGDRRQSALLIITEHV